MSADFLKLSTIELKLLTFNLMMDMLVRELKDELEARSESKTGNKAWLRRRLHGAIVRHHLDAAV